MGQANDEPVLSIWHQRKEVHLRKAATSVWCVSDGTAGMRYQPLALAAIMGWDQSAEFRDIVVTPHPILRHLPRLGNLLPSLPLTQDATPPVNTISTIGDYPSILVTCGRRMAGMSIALKARAHRDGANMTTIHLQDPRLDPAYFDMVIVPHHDRARGDNVIVTKAALNRMNKSYIAASADSVPQDWSRTASPRVAVLIGGDNRRYKISNDMAVQMGEQLTAFAAANDAHLFLVPSRRCPDLVLRQLTSLLPSKNCFVAANDQPNPYPGVLAIADAVIVTSDSVNMASEAASTGKPVLIAYWRAETGRIAKFHNIMQAAKHTAPLTKMLAAEPFVPLDESDMVRQQVSARLTS